jgi:hypothetical protein
MLIAFADLPSWALVAFMKMLQEFFHMYESTLQWDFFSSPLPLGDI